MSDPVNASVPVAGVDPDKAITFPSGGGGAGGAVPAPENDPNGPAVVPEVTTPEKPNFAPITSQEDLDKMIGKRLAKEREKFEDYDDIKAKADEYEKYLDSQKDEQTRLNEAYEKTQQELEAARKQIADYEVNQLRAEIAAEKGLTLKQAKRLTGTSREELEADADDLLESFPTKAAPAPSRSTSTRPIPTGGSNPEKEAEHKSFDASKKADEIFARTR